MEMSLFFRLLYELEDELCITCDDLRLFEGQWGIYWSDDEALEEEVWADTPEDLLLAIRMDVNLYRERA